MPPQVVIEWDWMVRRGQKRLNGAPWLEELFEVDILNDLYQLVQGLIVNIPVDNAVGAIYVFLNTAVLLLLSLLGFSGSGGGLFGSFF